MPQKLAKTGTQSTSELVRGSAKFIALLRLLLAMPAANKNDVNNFITNENIKTTASEGKKKRNFLFFLRRTPQHYSRQTSRARPAAGAAHLWSLVAKRDVVNLYNFMR